MIEEGTWTKKPSIFHQSSRNFLPQPHLFLPATTQSVRISFQLSCTDDTYPKRRLSSCLLKNTHSWRETCDSLPEQKKSTQFIRSSPHGAIRGAASVRSGGNYVKKPPRGDCGGFVGSWESEERTFPAPKSPSRCPPPRLLLYYQRQTVGRVSVWWSSNVIGIGCAECGKEKALDLLFFVHRYIRGGVKGVSSGIRSDQWVLSLLLRNRFGGINQLGNDTVCHS